MSIVLESPDSPVEGECKFSAVSYGGLEVTTREGKPATLAVIDGEGRVVAAGPEIVRAAWKASVLAYRNFLMGAGHLRVHTAPPKTPR